MTALTLYDKLWNAHEVIQREDGVSLLYIDRHLIHEVTSPQAFEGLRLSGRSPWRLSSNLATPDHNVPTTQAQRQTGIDGIEDDTSRIQVTTLMDNCSRFKIPNFPINDPRQGIVHVIGPEQGFTLPGTTVVCGDSHTSTHGAFATLAQGIGTSEVEHVLATQCLQQKKMKNMRIWVKGSLKPGVSAKDMALYIIRQIGTAGGTGYTIEFSGEAVRQLSMEGRMTLCNMAIEAGARSGIVAYDKVTEDYLKKHHNLSDEHWQRATNYWRTLISDSEAKFDTEHRFDAAKIDPQISWGTSPEMVVSASEAVPETAHDAKLAEDSYQRSMAYMGLAAGQTMQSLYLDKVFIGSCTNSRIEDLRDAAKVVKGKRIAETIKQAIVVPGSGLVKEQAEQEGLDSLFKQAGFEWREPGCSMCLAMNADKLGAGERCASTSNRNFEGRQGYGGRTHLVSPAMAAAAAIAGHFVDVSDPEFWSTNAKDQESTVQNKEWV